MPLAADAYRHVMGVLQYPFHAMAGAASLAKVRHVADASDLAALPALLGAYFVAKRALDTIPEGPGHYPIGT